MPSRSGEGFRWLESHCSVGLTAEEVEALYRRRYAGFRRAVAVILRDDELAHDAVQEGFARVFRKRRQFSGRSPEAWAWRIVLNAAWDARRSERRAQVSNLFEAADVRSQRDPELADAIRSLPARRRAVVFLRYFGELSYAEIAETLGISEGAVGATLAAAHRDLSFAVQREGVDI